MATISQYHLRSHIELDFLDVHQGLSAISALFISRRDADLFAIDGGELLSHRELCAELALSEA